MQVNDLVRYMDEDLTIGVIVAVGYGEEYTSTEQSCALHPDIWVLVNGHKERWNERCVMVINDTAWSSYTHRPG